MDLAGKIEKITGIETRATVLGYVQRGGSPTAFDHMMASQMGIMAVECISKGKFNRVIVHRDGKIKDIDMEKALSMTKTIDASTQSFPAPGSFPLSQLFPSGGQSTGVSASTSVLPMNTQD